jgi:hypothetical protein
MTVPKPEKVTSVAEKEKTVKKYPANDLKEPRKAFADTFSAVTALKQEFNHAT